MKRHFLTLITFNLVLFAGSPLFAVDLMYVSMENTVVTYDVSLGTSSAIAASAQTFASSNLSVPFGLAFDTSGNLYAANNYNSTISKFNSSGVFQSNFGTGNLNTPYGLAFDTSGNLYAANFWDKSISKFDSAGAFQTSIPTNQFGNTGLAFDTSGNLYVANNQAGSISKYNSAGIFQNSFGSVGPYNLFDLAFESSGNLYATNTFNSTISIFNQSGAYQSSISSNLPKGLAFDGSGNLYVANDGDKTISKFSQTGIFLFSWPTVSSPRYIAFAPVIVPEPSTWIFSVIAISALGALARGRNTK